MTSKTTDVATERVRLVTAPQSAGAFLRCVVEGRFERATFFRAVRPDNDQETPTITVVHALVADNDKPQLTVEHQSTAVTGISDVNGAVSLARRRPGTGTPTHFAICLGDQPALDHGGLRVSDGQGGSAFRRGDQRQGDSTARP